MVAAPRILWLDEIAADQRGIVGGKAASLGEMVRAGFPVPPGFCVTTAAYRGYVDDHHLQRRIEALAEDPDRVPDPQALFASPIDEGLKREILAAAAQLLDSLPAGDLLAVRSSATGEDLPGASFAGQGETYLNVSPRELLARIRDCWASLWSARAISYRQRGADTPPAPEMAVVVQAMIPCHAGGVAFTAHPLGRDDVVIEAARGPARAVVQGTGKVTRCTVDRTSLTCDQDREDVLTPAQVRLIAETALALERHFGEAQDVEWGLRSGKLYLFQSRPVTSQADRFFTQVIPGDDYLWTAGYLNERFPRPVSPLGWSIVGGLVEELAFRDPLRYLGYRRLDQLPLTKLYRGHPYANVAVFQILYKVFPDALVPDDAARYFPSGDVGLRKQAPYPCCLPDPRFIGSMLWHFVRKPANWSPLHNYRHWARFARRHDQAMAELARRLEQADAVDDLWRIVEAAQRWNRQLLGIHRWSLMAADLTVPLLSRLVGSWVSQKRKTELCARLLSGLPNKSLEVDGALQRLAQKPSLDGADLQDFLAEFGHRSFSLDIYHPTFADQPQQVLGLLELTGEGPDPAARVAERQSAESEVKSAIAAKPFGRLKLLAFDRVLALARRYVALREDQRFAWQRTLALMRRAFLRIGERLAAAELLAQADDVFFATFEELEDLSKLAQMGSDIPPPLRETISARKATFQRLQREFEMAPDLAYPAFLRGNRPLETAADRKAGRWQGVPVSPGLARGPARVVLTPGQFDRIAPGDILVTRSTDPGWTPIFGRLGGLVMEHGGQLSHGSIVAREYGLPAVVGIPLITKHLHDDDLVIVDGLAGRVALDRRR